LVARGSQDHAGLAVAECGRTARVGPDAVPRDRGVVRAHEVDPAAEVPTDEVPGSRHGPADRVRSTEACGGLLAEPDALERLGSGPDAGDVVGEPRGSGHAGTDRVALHDVAVASQEDAVPAIGADQVALPAALTADRVVASAGADAVGAG